MDYTVYSIDTKPDSTGFVEIVAGKYSGKHWQPNSMLVWEDAFTLAEKPLVELVPGYDHLGMNELDTDQSKSVVVRWEELAEGISNASPDSLIDQFTWADWDQEWILEELTKNQNNITSMLRVLASGARRFIEEKQRFCVLGV